MRIVLDDAAMDAAATRIGSVGAGLAGVQSRLSPALSAGAPPAIKGQVDAAVAQARATVAGVAAHCPARARELRRRAILARLADGDLRVSDLAQLRAWQAERPFANARVGNGKLGGWDPLNAMKAFADDVSGAGADVAGAIADNALGVTQTSLDLLGLVPGFGEPADGINALIYASQGDEVNAGLSAAGMIPFLGWGATGGKIGGKIKHVVDAGGGGGHNVGKAAQEAAERTERIRMARELLVSRERAEHILTGELKYNSRGKPYWYGGHRYPGRPGKSAFPKNWSDDRILDTAADMASRRDRVKVVDVEDGGRRVLEERHDGLLVHVVIEADGRVVTAYPPDVVKVPKLPK